jgi:hypothetical protein
MVRDLDIKVRWAYLNLKRKIELQFTLYLIALLLATSLIIANFVYDNPLLKIWSVILVILLFVKIGYDSVETMRREYADFRTDHKGKLPELK